MTVVIVSWARCVRFPDPYAWIWVVELPVDRPDRVLFDPVAGNRMSNIGSRMGYRIVAVRKRAL